MIGCDGVVYLSACDAALAGVRVRPEDRPLPEPKWSEIYWGIVFIECVTCHGPPNQNIDENPNNPLGGVIPGGANAEALSVLDLSGLDDADTGNWPVESHGAVANVGASTIGMCAGQGILVSPADSDSSLMIHKMRGTQTCGQRMPPGNLLSTELVDVVAEWIDLGAAND